MKSGVFRSLACFAVCSISFAAEPPPAVNRPVDFIKDVQPILSSRCYECHGEKKQKAELRWDVKGVALKGGEHGVPLIPGNSAGSLVIQMVAGLKGKDLVMPAKGEPLSPEQIGILRAWIDQGAVWPEQASAKVTDKRDHWAFKAPVRPEVQKSGKRKAESGNPIDAFILTRLEKEKLKPSPEADRVTLIRRLSLDLIGLPPTPKEVDAFVADKSSDAYEELVERFGIL